MPIPVLLAAYETCRRILAECVALLRPGTPGSALYERALEVASEAGYADRFMGAGEGRVRFVGHCIGLELNEPPYLAQRLLRSRSRSATSSRSSPSSRSRGSARSASRTPTSSADDGPGAAHRARARKPVIA